MCLSIAVSSDHFACDSTPVPGRKFTTASTLALDERSPTRAGQPGPCVLDQFTGLIWEAKTESAGLHDRHNTYSWFNPDEDAVGELDYRGKPNGGSCSGSDCDTHAFVAAVNEAGHCGFNDWRMPTRDELGSISDPRKTATPRASIPSISRTRSPATTGHPTTTSSIGTPPGYGVSETAWTGWSGKNPPNIVRLVRGEADYLERIKD